MNTLIITLPDPLARFWCVRALILLWVRPSWRGVFLGLPPLLTYTERMQIGCTNLGNNGLLTDVLGSEGKDYFLYRRKHCSSIIIDWYSMLLCCLTKHKLISAFAAQQLQTMGLCSWLKLEPSHWLTSQSHSSEALLSLVVFRLLYPPPYFEMGFMSFPSPLDSQQTPISP